MLFKMYRNVFKSTPFKERRKIFNRLYEKHGVEVVGVWKNADNPLEFYMITKYRDREHYESFIKAVKDDEEYKEMTDKLNEIRIKSDIKDLILEEY